MQNQFEAYLAQIERQLASLPAEQRDAELREIRLHLQMMVEDYIAIGDTPDEAMAAALRQFGVASKIGQELQYAGSEDRLRRWRQLLAGAATYAVYVALYGPFCALMDGFGYWLPQVLSSTLTYSTAFAGSGLVAGWVAETIAPRKAIWPVVMLHLFLLYWFTSPTTDYSGSGSLSIVYAGIAACVGTWARQRQVKKRRSSTLLLSGQPQLEAAQI